MPRSTRGYPWRIEGVGRISPPLGTFRLNGDTMLAVSPWAAIGTDVLLIGSGVSLFILSEHWALKALGATATGWGLIALTVEIVKLTEGVRGPSFDTIRRE